MIRKNIVGPVSSFNPIAGYTSLIKYENDKCKQHKNSTPKHKTIRTTTEVSPWNDQLCKISGRLKATQYNPTLGRQAA